MVLKKAFSLLEVLIAISITAIILAGALSMTSRYVHKLAWDRLFSTLENAFLKANASALAGIGEAEQYHLYLEKTADEPMLWYVETESVEGSGNERKRNVVRQERIEVPTLSIALDSLELAQSFGAQALMTFTRPFAFLQFQLLSEKLSKSGDALASEFDMPSAIASCANAAEPCVLTMSFVRPGTTQVKRMVFDIQKKIEHDF